MKNWKNKHNNVLSHFECQFKKKLLTIFWRKTLWGGGYGGQGDPSINLRATGRLLSQISHRKLKFFISHVWQGMR